MRYFVAYDGTPLSRAALARVWEFAGDDDEITVGTAIKTDDMEFARERGWLDTGEPWDIDAVSHTVRQDVLEIAPTATFEYIEVGRWATAGTIGSRLRRLARSTDPDIVAVGSDNAGHEVSTISSVASSITSLDETDVLIVRREQLS